MSEWVDVSTTEMLPPGQHRVVDIDGVQVAVFNVGGEYFAIEDVCTHDGGELASGRLEGEVVVCPRHGARFSLRSGAVLGPPAYEAVAAMPVRVVDGLVQVRDSRWD